MNALGFLRRAALSALLAGWFAASPAAAAGLTEAQVRDFAARQEKTWNARDLTGAPVPASRYTWTLRVEGADGTGPAVSVDGTGVPSGTVTIA